MWCAGLVYFNTFRKRPIMHTFSYTSFADDIRGRFSLSSFLHVTFLSNVTWSWKAKAFRADITSLFGIDEYPDECKTSRNTLRVSSNAAYCIAILTKSFHGVQWYQMGNCTFLCMTRTFLQQDLFQLPLILVALVSISRLGNYSSCFWVRRGQILGLMGSMDWTSLHVRRSFMPLDAFLRLVCNF